VAASDDHLVCAGQVEDAGGSGQLGRVEVEGDPEADPVGMSNSAQRCEGEPSTYSCV
jgi:hypothetical protein